MLTGKELGAAIAQAIALKKASGAIKREADVAAHFGVKQPSLADWKKRGTISKEKLPELWHYFSDIVGPEHWGLKEFSTSLEPSSILSADEKLLLEKWRNASKDAQEVARFVLSRPAQHPPDWADSDARAYVDSLQSKARNWQETNKKRNALKNQREEPVSKATAPTTERPIERPLGQKILQTRVASSA